LAEALAYLPTLALFSFVIIGSARIRHEMMLVACIPPVFVALIVGFIMAIYASDTFGLVPTMASLLIGVLPAWMMAARLKSRDLLITIYLAWAIALVLALIAFRFPDQPE
jgi:hypothetical protein